MNIVGWIIFFIAALGCLAVWQHNKASLEQTRDYYGRQIQDLRYNAKQHTERDAAATERLQATLSDARTEYEKQNRRQLELTASLVTLTKQIEDGEAKRAQTQRDIIRIQEIWNELQTN